MTLVKAFVAALGLYAALNFGLYLVWIAASGYNLVSFLAGNYILAAIFAPAVVDPAGGFIAITSLLLPNPPWISLLFKAIYYILPPVLSALVAGKLAEEPKYAFIAWFLVPVIFSVVTLVLAIALPGVVTIVFGVPNLDAGYIVLYCILFGIVNGIMWSGLACLVSGP